MSSSTLAQRQHVAGLVEEAGGHVNNYLAGDGLTKGNPILACTPELAAVLGEGTGVR